MTNLTLSFSKKEIYALLFVAFVAFASFQNFFAIVFSSFDYTVAKSIIALKEIYLYFFVFLYFLLIVYRLTRLRLHLTPFEICILSFLVFITAYGIRSPYFNILSYRQAIILPVCLLFGIFFYRKTDLQTVKKYIFPIFVIVALSGFVEILLYDSQET